MEWDDSSGSYLIGDWQSLEFDYYQHSATATAAVVDLEVANPVATVGGLPVATDPTVTGRVAVQDNGPLDGVTVQVSPSAGGSPEQSTTTDAEGGFSVSLAGLSYGQQTVYARTVRYDPNSGQAFTSAWTTAGVSPLTFDYVPTPSFSSLGADYAAGLTPCRSSAR